MTVAADTLTLQSVLAGRLDYEACHNLLKQHSYNLNAAIEAAFDAPAEPLKRPPPEDQASDANKRQVIDLEAARPESSPGSASLSARRCRLSCTGTVWEVRMGGRYQPYDLPSMMQIECAYEQGQASVEIHVHGMPFEVQFSKSDRGQATQRHRQGEGGNERPVRRRVGDCACDDHPCLRQARRVRRGLLQPDAAVRSALAWAQQVEERRREMICARQTWDWTAVTQQQPLAEKKVAVVGTCALGRAEVQATIVESGGKLPTAGLTADKRVNSKTDIVVIGIGQQDAAVHTARLKVEELNPKRPAQPIVVLTEVELFTELQPGAPAGSYPDLVRSWAAARDELQLCRTLLKLTLEQDAWREQVESRPLDGLAITFTGVMLALNWSGHEDTHRDLTLLVEGCGARALPTLAKQQTDILVVGRGEKGENGKTDGKGLDVRTSSKWRQAHEYNTAAASQGNKPQIIVLWEEELLPFLLSGESRKIIAKGGPPERAVAFLTKVPTHRPDVRAVRYTSIAQQAHGCGEPGTKGAVLADALAAPLGLTCVNAFVAAQSMNSAFVWTMLQKASVGDGAPAHLGLEELVLVQWSGGLAEEEDTMVVVEEEERRGGSQWLGGLHRLPTVGRAPGETTAVGTRHLPLGLNPHLDAVCEARSKPRIGVAHALLAHANLGRGRCHSKFWILHFKPIDGQDGECVRLVVSSGNALTGSFGGMPTHRQLCGLWWMDFAVRDSAQPPSPFRAALIDHCEEMLRSRDSGGEAGCDARDRARLVWGRMKRAWEHADLRPADEANATLISHTPGVFPAVAAPGQVPKGSCALRACFLRALKHPEERLDLAVIAHSCSGWAVGGDGEERFREWCAAAAPNGGTVRFHWPRRADATIFGEDRIAHARGIHDCSMPEWVRHLRLVTLRLRPDVLRPSGTESKTEYVCTPHLMLYILHEPLSAADELPQIRRILLTSANLSAAPWGYSKGSDEIEVRSFELGICVEPSNPSELVEPLCDAMTLGPSRWSEGHARAIPFHFGGPGVVCDDPYVGRAVVRGPTEERGQLNY
mmetsp:Transcript_85644/g.256563  ORF Transcript_85644/g.256563 Transcript_85644/m.256563 type:complete len:1047 (+) Transcript_85644:72-3212(+)